MRRMLIALLPLAIVACSKAAPPTGMAAGPDQAGETGMSVAEEQAAGQEIAETHCARCHGIGDEDARRPDAPPLRHLLAEYDPEALKDDFREGVKVGHPDMPQFEFSPMETDMLLSYISSIQEPEAE
ncbi:MAG TPA: cytochrome c [Hyphomonas sp.]|nr:cytochrome c [Hyphomonas sp.]HPE49783.1 cytochrome c [Hyphomonas sp.]